MRPVPFRTRSSAAGTIDRAVPGAPDVCLYRALDWQLRTAGSLCCWWFPVLLLPCQPVVGAAGGCVGGVIPHTGAPARSGPCFFYGQQMPGAMRGRSLSVARHRTDRSASAAGEKMRRGDVRTAACENFHGTCPARSLHVSGGKKSEVGRGRGDLQVPACQVPPYGRARAGWAVRLRQPSWS